MTTVSPRSLTPFLVVLIFGVLVSNRSTRARLDRSSSPVGGSRRLAAAAAVVAAASMLVAGCGGKSHDHPASSPSEPSAVGKLPEATTFITLKNIPKDAGAVAATDGTVAHPTV